MKVGRDYAWWVSYSWTYEWLEEESGEWITDTDFESERFYCQKKDIKNEAKRKVIESMIGIKHRNLEITIGDCYRTTIEEI